MQNLIYNNLQAIMGYMEPPILSELTPMIFNTGITHLGSEASIKTLVL